VKFTLEGYKLKGSWVLVRTGGRWGSKSGSGDARSWLLIKHRDDWAGEVDITEFAPRSVKSEGDFEDILAADRPDVWESHRPAEGGAAGAMLSQIIERAARLKAGKTAVVPGGDSDKGKGKAPAARASGGGAPRAVKKAVRKPRTGTSTTRKRRS
jgi:hypothetical protein